MWSKERHYANENDQKQKGPSDGPGARAIPHQIHPRTGRFFTCVEEGAQAAITLLYVAPPAYRAGEFGDIDYAQLEASMKDGGQKKLDKLAAELATGEVSVDTLVRVGSPAGEVIETARRLPADLIVISTHGRTGLKHVFLGSVAEHVVQRAPCPVFVVRENEHEILGS